MDHDWRSSLLADAWIAMFSFAARHSRLVFVIATRLLLTALPLVVLTTVAGCEAPVRGPVRVIAIGPAPAITNPNRDLLGPASAMLLEGVAQGLVRFDASGEIEPGLAQSWIVSDDGRRYTFRLRRAQWSGGQPVTAAQVVARLQATTSRASRNPLKPALGAIAEVEAMTDQVLEIRLISPRPNFLQLLAQPEMALIVNGQGTGPYRAGTGNAGWMRMVPPAPEDDETEPAAAADILLTAADAAEAIAAFSSQDADLVTGGTIGAAPLLAAADLPDARTVFDPVEGMFGLIVTDPVGPLSDPRFRAALAMAIDREAIAARFAGTGFQPRSSLIAPAIAELGAPALPDWAGAPLPARRQTASEIVAGAPKLIGPLRIAVSEGLGYRIVFAHLRRDWRAIGVDVERVAVGAPAQLRLIDEVAPAELASWYLRHFTCDQSPICDAQANVFIEAARTAATSADRREMLAQADRALTAAAVYVPIGTPVRWSLRSQRLNGVRANRFSRHNPTELIADRN